MATINGVVLSSEIKVNRLISAFYYDMASDFDYGGEQHRGWEFVYVEKGSVSVKADQAVYILKSGEMVCHKPMEFHKINPYQGDASVIIFCFECAGDRMKFFNKKILHISKRQKQYLNDIVSVADKLFLPKNPLEIAKDGSMDRSPLATVSHEQYIKNTIELLILSLMDSESTARDKRVEYYEHCLHRKTLTADIIEYLENNIASQIKLTDISNEFSYSLSSIKRIFKNETGYSIIDYLNNMRIEKAKEILTDGRISIENVAAMVGFSNIYYFSNVFKNRTGKSPRKFRTEIKNNDINN